MRDKEFLDQVEEAARRGAKRGRGGGGIGGFLEKIPMILILLGIGFVAFLVLRMRGSIANLKEQIGVEKPVETHDTTLENQGFFGYTAADFQEAVIAEGKQSKELEVYTADVYDIATVTDTGFAKLKIFTKQQVVTYHGTAIYTVDLSGLTGKDITVDNDKQIVTIRIPHARLKLIDIPSDRIEYGEITKGILSFGKLDVTPEEMNELETEARGRIEQKLVEEERPKEADRFAALSVWEIYQPLVSKIAPGYSLEVVNYDL